MTVAPAPAAAAWSLEVAAAAVAGLLRKRDWYWDCSLEAGELEYPEAAAARSWTERWYGELAVACGT